MSSFGDVAGVARASWLSNYTIGDERWRLRQLHGLHKLVVNNQEKIVSALASAQSVPTVLYEREVAILVKELHGHISKLNAQSPSKLMGSARWGEISVAERPLGVSLIVSNSQNLLRFGLGPLAASIAANNVVILATSASNDDAFISCLQQEWRTYLDPDSLFLVPGASVAEIDVNRFDHISIFDSCAAEYSAILQSPRAHFNSVPAGYSFAIIDEGKKDWKHIAEEVFSNSTDQKLASDRLSAVFVRAEDVDEFRLALTRLQAAKPGLDNSSAREEPLKQNCTPWGGNVFYSDLSSPKRPQDGPAHGLKDLFRLSQACGALLIVAVSSLDEVLGLINNLLAPIEQLAFLASGSRETAAYVRKWVDASTFSLENICMVPLPILNSATTSPGASQPLFPSAAFSRLQITAEKALVKLPGTIPAIRATYENLIPAFEPEPRGERIGFFTQVEYLIKGLGVAVGLMGATGLYFGIRAVQKRLH